MRSLVRWCAAPLFGAIALEATGAQRPAGDACQTIVWSAPDSLRTPSGLAVFVEHPQIVQAGVGTVLIGSWGAEVDSMPRALTAGYSMGADGTVRSIPMPVAFPSWGAPRAAAEPGDAVTVLWTAEDSARHGGAVLRAAELRTDGWGPISSIEMPGPFVWNVVSPSALVAGGGMLAMMVPAAFGERHGAILVRKAAGRWGASSIPLENLNYARLLPLRGDTLLMAYVASGNPDGNTLYIRRLTASGDTVGPRMRVSVPGAGPVYDPMLVASGDSLIQLAWAVLDTAGLLSRLSLAGSRDRGLAWERRPDLVIEHGFDIPRAAVDPGGRLHIVARGERDGAPHPIHATWDGSVWRSFAIPAAPGVVSAGTPFLLFTADGGYHGSWAAAAFRDTIFAAPVSLVSVGRERCAREAPDDTSALALEIEDPRFVEDRSVMHPGGRPKLPAGLGTHVSVRGAAPPRAVHQYEQRGINAAISGRKSGPVARGPGHGERRVRGPPRDAARAGRGAKDAHRRGRLHDDRRDRVLRVRGRLLPESGRDRQHLGAEDHR